MLDALLAAHARGETPALAVVAACSGPTYRKPGALALFDAAGLAAGALSGGCLEEELAHAARAALGAGRAVRHAVDTGSADDLLFGTGSGCGGRMDVLLLPLPPQAPLAAALRALRESATPLRIALRADGGGTARMDHGPTWHWPAAVDGDAGTRADAHFAIAPPPRLLALGAGPETPALLQFLQRLGWIVEVQEHRARWAGYAAGADALHDARPGTLPGAGTARCRAAVVMTHRFDGDLAHLAALAATAVPYVGLLGPTTRRDALLAALDAGAAAALRPRLRAPVGLHLGGEGPEAIALAIAAGLTAHLNGRTDA
ncbi:MAG: XdhC family protein [Mizugakiibacter sp.]|uniref:XdhC family protein n=1 Tax=Mizugakiibacter sp. TaxID=1972610 RepID=UPI0031C5888E|nr:XdhC family protein [Xanthomonadaceae bacterium]